MGLQAFGEECCVVRHPHMRVVSSMLTMLIIQVRSELYPLIPAIVSPPLPTHAKFLSLATARGGACPWGLRVVECGSGDGVYGPVVCFFGFHGSCCLDAPGGVALRAQKAGSASLGSAGFGSCLAGLLP